MNNKEVQDSLKQVGIRLVEEPPLLSLEPMNNPETAVRVLGKWLSEMDRELFCVVNLNTNLTPINMNVVSMGALNVAYVHPRDTMKSAILSNAAYMMLIHNHPSGSMTPSKEDIKITDQIQSAASLMGIPVLDHIIVGRHQEFFSIRENNVFSYQNDMQYTSDISKLRWTQQSSVAESTSYGGQNSDVTKSKMDTIMNSLERGVHEIFTSEKYHIYLNTMSKFHNYSFNNTLLIAMQRPDATLVAGYQTWKKKFNRQVQRGEKGIKIIAPAPIKEKRRVEKVDEETQEIVIGDDGQPETEIVERITPRFRVTTVFDVSQTEGEPLPTLGTTELEGNVVIYEDFMKGLEELSPVPFRFEDIGNGAKGYYSEKYIAIQRDMSNAQTMKTAVHETAHAILHDRDIMQENGVSKDRTTKEVEAESVAYVVCSHFGLDTSEYSFGYIASWSSGKEMSELRNSMDTIRTSSSQLITDITDRLQELQKNREEEKTEDVKVINSIEGIDFNTDADPQGTGGIKVADERILFTRKEDFYAIYQYDHTDGNWGYEFMGLDFAENMGMTVDGKDYRLMYLNTLNKDDTLDQLFMKFNIDRPDDFEGHSLSTSDVIIMKREGELKAYYVDSIGFKKLPNFALQRADLLNVSIKSEYPPVYMETWENAFEKKEVDAYLDSRMLNISCKNAVEQAITENYNGKYLDSNGVFAVIEKFGVERVRYVLANTLQQRSNDGRFSRQNISWAEQIKIPENITQGKNHNLDYVIESHSAVLNGFVDMARAEFRTRRVEQLLDEVEERMPEVELDELAYKINNKYFAIQKTEGGYDYTYYDENYRDIDGGIYEDDTVPITEVVQNLLDEEGLSLNDAKEIDYEELQSNIDDVHMQEYTKDAENYLDQNEIKKLAVDLDNFSYDYDPYVYNDNVENKEEQEITEQTTQTTRKEYVPKFGTR